MATARSHWRYTIEEYLHLEEHSNLKHEFHDGQILAMSGGTPEHALYAANVIGILRAQLLDGPCRVYTSDLRVRVQASGLDTDPDASVVCGELLRDREDKNAAVNPVLLVEVTSPSSEAYDRGQKLDEYRTIPALREVLLVAHDAQRVDVVTRRPDGTWHTTSAGPGETLTLALGATLSVDAVYR